MATKSKTHIKIELTDKQVEFLNRVGLSVDQVVVPEVPEEVFQLLLSYASIPPAAKTKIDLVGQYGDKVVDLDFKNKGQSLEKLADFDPDKMYTTVPDAAKRLNTSDKTIYRWFLEGKLTKTKFMGKILVLESEIVEIEKGRETLKRISER